MATSGRMLLSSIVYEGSTKTLMGLSLFPELFRETEVALYTFIRLHVLKYGKVPSIPTVVEALGEGVLVPTNEPPAYYLDQVERRLLQSQMKGLVLEVQDLLKDQDPDKAFEIMLNGAFQLKAMKTRKDLVDFRHIESVMYTAYMATKAMTTVSSFGWPTIDQMTGGLKAGDYCSIVGRPASGKTFLGLYSAHKAWTKACTPLFVSMEMTTVSIGQRLSSMHSHKKLTQLIKGSLSTVGWKEFMLILKGLKTAEKPFWLVDGRLTSTVDDIIMHATQLKPDCVWVDGAYLLKHPNPRINRFERITENAEWLKQRVATDLGLPVICSYQFSREYVKKKKAGAGDGDIGLEDIYGTDSIGQLSSVVLGLLQHESIETELYRTVRILKGRDGEKGSFSINWDFNGMDFSEVNPPGEDSLSGDKDKPHHLAELQFLA